ncbi:DUF4401 domain-containing protein [bacterium]|nr:DUF4401 domain-containing protein [bacterium]
MNVSQLVETIQQEGHLEGVSGPLPPAWYIRVLSALGAWLATLFLAIFCLASDLEIWWGLGQCLLAAVLARQLRHEFVYQLSLSLWLTGCCLVTFSSLRFGMDAAALLLLLSLCYSESLGRFLTALAAGLMAVASVDQVPMPMDLVVGPLALLAGAHYLNQQQLWRRGWGRHTASLAGAAVVTLLAALSSSFWNWCQTPAGRQTTLLLTLAVLWLATRVIARLQIPVGQGLWALGGVLMLGALTLNTPGIMAGVGVLLLAREARDRWLVWVGWIYLLLFTTAFYYNLDLLLRTKSLILLAMGALLLGLRRKLL